MDLNVIKVFTKSYSICAVTSFKTPTKCCKMQVEGIAFGVLETYLI